MEDILRASVEIGLGDEDSGDSGEGRAGNADKGRGMHQGRAKRAGALSEYGELQVCSPTSVYHLMTDWILVCIWHSAAVVLHISPGVRLLCVVLQAMCLSDCFCSCRGLEGSCPQRLHILIHSFVSCH